MLLTETSDVPSISMYVSVAVAEETDVKHITYLNSRSDSEGSELFHFL
jgi:hypothetical protein